MPLPSRVAELAGFDLLLSVARLGGIGAAARAHGISQPAASARIQQLEARIGVALVDRSPRGSRLSPAGALVADWARPVVEAAAHLEAGLAALGDEHGSHLHVAASLSVAEHRLPTWLAAFRTREAATAVVLSSGDSTAVAGQVLDGHADLGFIDGPDLPSGLTAEDIGADRLRVVVKPEHPWAKSENRPYPQELAATPLVSRAAGSGTRRTLAVALAPHELAEPAIELTSTTAIKSAVLAGVAPAVLGEHTVATELSTGTLVGLDVPGVELRRALRVVWRAGQQLRGPAADLAAIAARGA